MNEQDLPVSPAEAVLPAEHPAPPSRRRLQRRPLEATAIAIMALGAAMMFQPWFKDLFSYSFVFILLGTAVFTVVSHLPD